MSAKKSESASVDSDNKWENFAKSQEEVEQDSPAEQVDDSSEQDKQDNQITALKQQLAEHKEAELRMAAQLRNVRGRLERDVMNAHKFGSEKLLKDLLPVADSLIRGLENSKEQTDVDSQSIINGIELTLDMLHKVLSQNGVERIAPEVGESFNPELHEAMSMQKVPEAANNTILQVLQQGYSLNGRVIRAAMVIVAG